HANGRIADAAVAMPGNLKVEQRGTVLGTVKGVGNGLVDGDGNGAMGRLGLIAAMNSDGFRPHGKSCNGLMDCSSRPTRKGRRTAQPMTLLDHLGPVPIRHLAPLINWLIFRYRRAEPR